ncbi:MAG: LysR family transcriptional regulator, partial [Faecalibacterium prausnitzii]
GRVKRILDMPAMFVWYFKEENTLRFWRLCGRIEKTRRKETAVTLQQLRYVTAVAGAGTISHAVQQFYISQPSLTNAIRELEQEVGLALSKTASSVVSRTLLDARGQMSAKSMHPPAYGQRKCQKKKGVQEKMKHLHKGGWCHPHSTRRLAFCRGCRIRQNTTPAKGALPGRLSPSTAALKTHRPRLRSAAMKAPVGLLSGRTVCDSRWRGLAPTSSTNVSKLLRRKK